MFGGALMSFPISASAADLTLSAPPPAGAIVEGPACLRWVWQEYSWYDDCAPQRHPYIGRSAWSARRVHR
jgi:hypothetical protein